MGTGPGPDIPCRPTAGCGHPARQRIGEQHRKLPQRGDHPSGLGRHACDVGDDLLAPGLGLILEPEKAGSIDQLEQARELFLGQMREEVLLGGDVGADVAALGGVEPVGVVLARTAATNVSTIAVSVSRCRVLNSMGTA